MMRRGFTIVEVMIVVVVIAILAGVSTMAYNGWQKSTAEAVAKSDLLQAASLLKNYHNFNNGYPSRIYSDQLSGSEGSEPQFKPSSEDIVTLNYHTNASSHVQYTNMTQPQQLVLFMEICKEVMSSTESSIQQSYHNSCAVANLLGILGLGGLQGIKMTGTKTGTIKPTSSGGKYWVNNNFTIDCGWTAGFLNLQACDPYDSGIAAYKSKMTAVSDEIKSRFTALGGTFPVEVPALNLGFTPVALPPLVTVVDQAATKYCVEAVSSKYGNFIYHVSSAKPTSLQDGSCPSDQANW